MIIKKYILNSLFVALAALNVSGLEASATANAGANYWNVGKNVLAGVAIVSGYYVYWHKWPVWEKRIAKERKSQLKIGLTQGLLEDIKAKEEFFKADLDQAKHKTKMRFRQEKASLWQDWCESKRKPYVNYTEELKDIYEDIKKFSADYKEEQSRDHKREENFNLVDNGRRHDFEKKIDAKIEELKKRSKKHSSTLRSIVDKRRREAYFPAVASFAALGCSLVASPTSLSSVLGINAISKWWNSLA